MRNQLMDMRKIKKLIELIQSTGVAEIEIKEGEESVRITRENKMTPIMMAPQSYAPNPLQAAPTHTQEASSESATTSHKKSDTAVAPEKHTIKAPMVGTVYLSATPGAKS